MQLPRGLLPNNIQLDDIARSTNNNNSVSHYDHLRTQLNDRARNTQTVQLEEKVIALNQCFEKASDAVRAHVLQEVEVGEQHLGPFQFGQLQKQLLLFRRQRGRRRPGGRRNSN
jgi:hypothetical protein